MEYFEKADIFETTIPMGNFLLNILDNLKRIEGFIDPKSGNPRVILTKANEIIQTIFSSKSKNLIIESSKPTTTTYIYTRVDPKNRLIVVEKGSNNFKAIDLDTKKLETTYPGNEEEPYSIKYPLKII